jgi:formate dehydrogenase
MKIGKFSHLIKMANSVLDRELVDPDIVISQPFYPAYLTRERLVMA